MRFIEGQDYATIDDHKMIKVDGDFWEWVPKCIVNSNAVIPPYARHGYLGTVFKIESKKPYLTRSRIKISGIFAEYLTLAGYREIEVWHEDLTTYTYTNGELVMHPKYKKKAPKKDAVAVEVVLDSNDDEVDDMGDDE